MAVIRRSTKAGHRAPEGIPDPIGLPDHCIDQFVFPTGLDAINQITAGTLSRTGNTTPALTEMGVGTKLAGLSGYFSGVGHELTEFAIEVLAMPTVATTASAIFTMAESPGSGTRDRSLYFDNAGAIHGYIYSGGQMSISGGSYRPYVANHIVLASSDANDLRLFVDGVLVGTVATGSSFTGYSTPEYVFGYGGGTANPPDSQGGAADLTSTSIIFLARMYDTDEIDHLIPSLAHDPWQYHARDYRKIFLPGTPAAATSSPTVIRRSTKAGHRAPSVITGINWASPLAQGLRFLVSFNSATPRELVTGSAVIANGSPTHVKRPKGGATDLDGSDFWSIADNDGFDITEELTLAWAGRIDTGSANRHFVGKHLSNGGAANPFDFRTGSEANPKLHLVRANTTHRWWVGNSSPIILGADHVHTISMSAAMEVSPVAYTDGVVPSTFTAHSGGGGTGPATGNSADLRIGRRPDGTVQMDGAVYFVAGWAREFGIGEHIAFGLNPYDLFLTNPRTISLPGAAAAATTGTGQTVLRRSL